MPKSVFEQQVIKTTFDALRDQFNYFVDWQTNILNFTLLNEYVGEQMGIVPESPEDEDMQVIVFEYCHNQPHISPYCEQSP